MARQRSATAAKTTVPPEEQPRPAADPLRLLWSLTAAALAVILAYLHAFPQAPYPLHGIAPSLGLIALAAASVLMTTRSPELRPRTLAPVLLPCIAFLWSLWRTSAAEVPTEGIPLLGTLLEGSLVFAIALTLAAVGGEWTSFSPYESPLGSDRSATAQMESDGSPTRSHALFLDSALVFLLALAAAMALWAIYQYFVLYDREAVLFRLRYGPEGLENLSPQEWEMFQALRTKRVGSRFGNPNVLAGFLSMIAPLAIGAAVLWKDRTAKAAALVSLGVIWYVVLLTGSRGGMLTLLLATVGGVAVLGRAAIRKQIAPLAIAAGVCIAAIFLAVASESRAPRSPDKQTEEPLPRVRYSFFERMRSSPTIAQRLYYLQSGWEMIRLAPWLGHGLGSYAVLYPTHKQPLAREARFPHNLVCHLWVETGLVGLLLWLAWIVTVLAIALARLRSGGASDRAIAIKALLVAAASFVLNNLFEMTWTFRETYLDWCLLLGLLVGLGATKAGAVERTERLPPSGPSRFLRGATAIAAVPFALGVVSANSLLICPMLAESYEMTATDLRKYGQGKEAVDEIYRLAQQMIRYQPRNAWYHQWLASFYRQLGRPAEAKAKFEEALRLNPRSAAIRADLALLHQETGNTTEARQLLVEALAIYPLKARYHSLLANLERQVGNRDAARQHIRTALQCSVDGRERPRFEKFLQDLDTTPTLKR